MTGLVEDEKQLRLIAFVGALFCITLRQSTTKVDGRTVRGELISEARGIADVVIKEAKKIERGDTDG